MEFQIAASSVIQLRALIDEAVQFTSMFLVPIMESVPHIYLSCLPFLPTESTIRENLDIFPNIVKIKRGETRTWSTHVTVLDGHSSPVCRVAQFSTLSLTASGSSDGTIRVWDRRTGDSRVLKKHTDAVTCLSFTPDQKRLISGSRDSTLIIWDVQTGLPICDPLTNHSRRVTTIATSPRDDLFASGSSDKTIRLWITKSGDQNGPAWKGEYRIHSVAFSPDGTQLASADRRTVKIWDVASSEVLQTISMEDFSPQLILYSPDSLFLVFTTWRGEICKVDLTTGLVAEDQIMHRGKRIDSISFSNSKNQAGFHELVSCSDYDSIRFWNANTGVESGPPLYTRGVSSVVYSPDGEAVISGSFDRTVRIWNRSLLGKTSKPLERHAIEAVAYSPCGKYIATGGEDGSVRIWTTIDGNLFAELPDVHSDGIFSIAYSPNGNRLAIPFGGAIQLRDAKKLEPIGTQWDVGEYPLQSIAFSPDGTKILSSTRGIGVGLSDLNQSPPSVTYLNAHRDSVTSFAFSPDGVSFSSCSRDGTVVIWRTETGTAIGEPIRVRENGLESMAYSPDGTKIAIGSTDDLTIWDVETRAMAGHLPMKHDDRVQSVAFSPCGDFVVSGCDDRAIRVWDLKRGVMLGKPLLGHTDSVLRLAISPDGRQITSLSSDRSVRVWDLRLDKASSAQSPEDVVLRDDELQYPTSIFPSSGFNSKDGWILGSSGELLLWIPHEHRRGLRGPGVRLLGEPITELSFEHFKCGTEWTKCYNGEVVGLV